MVIDPDLSPSRAGFLPLVGGNLALDFANTESGRGFATHQNHLLEASNVLDWLDHTNALPPEDTRWLRAETSARADLARTSSPRRGAALRYHAWAPRSVEAPPPRPRSRLSRLSTPAAWNAPLSPPGRLVSLALEPARRADRSGPRSDRARRCPAIYRGRLRPHQGMPRSRLRLALLRHEQEQSPALVRDGGLRQSRQAEAAGGPEARRLIRLLTALLAAGLLAGCSPVLETDQARLCRMALAALTPETRGSRSSRSGPTRTDGA